MTTTKNTSERDNNSVPSTSSKIYGRRKEFSCHKVCRIRLYCPFLDSVCLCSLLALFHTVFSPSFVAGFVLQQNGVCVCPWSLIYGCCLVHFVLSFGSWYHDQFYYSPLHFFVASLCLFLLLHSALSLILWLCVFLFHSNHYCVHLMVVTVRCCFFSELTPLVVLCVYKKCAININISFCTGLMSAIAKLSGGCILRQRNSVQEPRNHRTTRKIHFVLKIIIYLILLIFPIFVHSGWSWLYICVCFRIALANFWAIRNYKASVTSFPIRSGFYIGRSVCMLCFIVCFFARCCPFLSSRIVHLFWRAPKQKRSGQKSKEMKMKSKEEYKYRVQSNQRPRR